MNNLVKNELSKIFHKKALYIILIILIGFIFLDCILAKVFTSGIENIIAANETTLQQSIDQLDKNNPQDRDTYYSLSADLETLKLSKKYDKNSWQRYVVTTKGKEIIEPMLRSEGTDEYEFNKQKYDDFIQKLNSNDWKIFAKEELNLVNSEIKMFELMSEEEKSLNSKNYDILKDKKKVLEARLDKDIPYGNSTSNKILDSYVESASILREFENKDKLNQLSYSDKVEKQSAEASNKIYEYALNKKIDDRYTLATLNDQTALASKADKAFATAHSEYSLFIIIAIVFVAGTIVSEEANKGTIKLLLVRPYRRTKILLSKFLACLVVYLLVSIVVALLQFIIGGIFYGFNDYVGKIILYNFNAGTVKEISSIVMLFLSWLSILPEHIILLTLAFTISTVLNSSAFAIAVSLLGSMTSSIINGLAFSFKKAEFLRFFVTPNWNFMGRLFGKLPMLEGMTIPFSITICLLYFALLATLSIQVFKKRDIKNI